MKPAHMFAGHTTYDLTEGKLHRRDDGAIVVFFPEKWEVRMPKQTVATVSGTMTAALYSVLEWSECVLVPAPPKA